MKTLLTFLLLFISIVGYSQTLPTDSTTGKVTYSEVVTMNGTSDTVLYKRLKQWFIDTYKSGKDVIQDDDKSTFTISGKGSFPVTYNSMGSYEWGYVSYTLKVSCKNGRYKYILTNFYHSGSVKGYEASVGEITNTMELHASLTGKQKNLDQLKFTVDEHAKGIIQSLKNGMNNESVTKDDW
jgi:hypothetical protein